MSMYNKIFTKILDSSVWLESTPTRIVWLTFIAAMDETGYCQFASVGNLASRARVSMEEAKEAVKILEAPDPESADPDNEGRRIERVQGGWIVLNAEKYRALVTRANIQEKVRERVRRYRERKRIGNAGVTHSNPEDKNGNADVTPSDTDSYTDTKNLTPRRKRKNALPDGTSDAQNGSKVAFDEPKPDTVDVRCLSEGVGIFQMREQADMCRLLAVHVKESAQTVEGAIAAMVNRWKEYQTAMPLLEWTYGSSYKFFMSGNWNKPELWPRKTSPTASPPNPGSNGKAPPTEAEAYAMWQQTSEKFKLANPWCGSLANAEDES